MLLDEIGQLQHQSSTLGSGKQLPGGVLQGLAGSLDSNINVLLTGSVNGSNFRLVSAALRSTSFHIIDI